MDDKLYWIWLSMRLGAGNTSFLHLIDAFGSPYEVFRAEPEELYRIEGVADKVLSLLADKDLVPSSQILEYCAHKKIDIVTYKSENYPSRLKTLKNPPAVLYVLGKLPDFDNRVCIGVVGTRDFSEYGKRSAYKISYELATAGAVVVSGMALGIDAYASVGALEAGGDAVVVLGCGVDVVYPALHKKLHAAIASRGAVISEYPPQSGPQKYNFPQRNRIISGLCQGTLVVEADNRSGALITAREAILQGRDVYAVPGNLENKTSNGTNRLIRDGASVALSAKDILVNYEFLYGNAIDAVKLPLECGESDFRPELDIKYGFAKPSWFKKKSEAAKAEENAAGRKEAVAVKAEKENKSIDTESKSTPKAKHSDGVSQGVADSLPEKQKSVFCAIPLDRAASLDDIVRATAYSTAEVVSTLTMLEIKGLITSLPGGLYIRR